MRKMRGKKIAKCEKKIQKTRKKNKKKETRKKSGGNEEKKNRKIIYTVY